jgi:SAM-dependent methyltransferase
MSNAKLLFESSEIWSDYYYDGDAHAARFAEVIEAIPADASSLLDAGCGNGKLLRQILAGERKFASLHGTDYSAEALRRVPVAATEASIDALPFADGSYDIVTCLEVFEHLPQDVFAKARAELARIASKYIIVTTPYNERIDSYHISCPQCFCRFNPNYHLRRFTEAGIRGLFAGHGFEARRIMFLGPMRNYLGVTYLQNLRKTRDPLTWYVRTPVPCPACGEKVQPKTARAAGPDRSVSPHRRASGLLQLAKAAIPHWTAYSWIGALYERTR